MTPLARDEQVTAIAEAFAEVMRQWLTPAEFEEMRLRNTRYGPQVCASHDFCDANMAMDAAFEGLQIPTCLYFPDNSREHEEACKLWNEAWDLAKRLYFTA